MLKPSKRHFLRYDAQTYETQGFIEMSGIPKKMAHDNTKDQRYASQPRFWQITATAKTQEPATGEQQTKHFKFKPTERLKLSELAPLINDFIHAGDDFLPDCVSVMVCARVMTEGGS